MQRPEQGRQGSGRTPVGGDVWRRWIASTAKDGPFVRARLSSASPGHAAAILRGGHLDAYLTETICEDALRSGPGSRLEIVLGPETPRWLMAEVTSTFAWLRDRQIRVTVRPHHNGPVIAEAGQERARSLRGKPRR